MFHCPFCKNYSTKFLKNHIRHYQLHRSVSRRLYCGYKKCPRNFKTDNSLRGHLYKYHNLSAQEISVQVARYVESDENAQYKCSVILCTQTFHDFNKFLKHLKYHINTGTEVKCPVSHCPSRYSKIQSLTSHLSRYHKRNKNYLGKQKDLPTEAAGLIDGHQTEAAEHENDDFQCSFNTHDDDYEETSVDENELFVRNLANFYLKLECQKCIPVSTIQLIVLSLNELIEQGQGIMDKKLADLLLSAEINPDDISVITQIMRESNPYLANGKVLDSEYKRRNYYKRNFHYVAPQSIFLKIVNGTKRYFEYVPLEETIKSVFHNKSLKAEWRDKILPNKNTELLCDITDGTVYKDNPFFQENPDAIILILYQDSFEVVNPIGSAKKTHKILAVYCSFINLPPHIRTHINTIHLVALCTETHFDPAIVYGRIVDDLKKLESTGITLSSGETRKVGLLCIAGDNLGSHALGGYVENFSSTQYFCRYCLIRRDKFYPSHEKCKHCDKNHYVPADYDIRTIESYNKSLETLKNHHQQESKKSI